MVVLFLRRSFTYYCMRMQVSRINTAWKCESQVLKAWLTIHTLHTQDSKQFSATPSPETIRRKLMHQQAHPKNLPILHETTTPPSSSPHPCRPSFFSSLISNGTLDSSSRQKKSTVERWYFYHMLVESFLYYILLES